MVFVNLPKAGGHKVALWPGQYERIDVLEQRGEIKLHKPGGGGSGGGLPESIRLSSKTNGPPREKRPAFTPAGRHLSASIGRPSTADGGDNSGGGGGGAAHADASWMSAASVYSAAGEEHPCFSGLGWYGVPVARDIARERSQLRCSQTPPPLSVRAGGAR